LETGFLDFTWLEARASHIRTFSPLLIHGLLQTREYARAVTVNALGKDTPKETVARMVELRMIRQRILHKEHPTQLSVILEEPALRRAVGGPKVLHNQLIHLLELGSRPHISIRVLSSACTEWDAGHTGPFTNFSMPDPYPEVSYVENLAGQTFLEEAAKVERFQRTYDGLDRTALNANESTKLIKEFAKDLE
ncbi:MAG TPA: DUF5753 domain-containing protein, partial [Stackebrandtia sp.]|uniref:DUF5753 domain-containing protein n=1 Tax=Stackebrandtia sp. TaxID=2023065 RepID=UPI002D66EFCF